MKVILMISLNLKIQIESLFVQSRDELQLHFSNLEEILLRGAAPANRDPAARQ